MRQLSILLTELLTDRLYKVVMRYSGLLKGLG